jgi:glycerate kinase
MKIVLAPDSFKGCLSAAQVCGALRRGLERVLPDATILAVPLADGGEGTTKALVAATGGSLQPVQAMGPLGAGQALVMGEIALINGERTAMLEMACVSGLPLVKEHLRNPLHTTSYGTGELIRAALERGVRHLIIGIGGSATNEMGAGMAQALGVRFLDAAGEEIRGPLTGGMLAQVEGLDLAGLHPAVAACRIEVACDVENPLLGPRGCTAVYGPQKGATPAIVAELEANLEKLVGLLERERGRELRHLAGAGAAGGLGAGLVGFLGAELRPGIEIVLAASGLAGALRGADLVISGEGRIDEQTAYGKTISGVARLAQAEGVPLVAIVGGIGGGIANLYPLGVSSVFSLVSGPMTLEEALAQAEPLLADAAERVLRLVLAYSRPPSRPRR